MVMTTTRGFWNGLKASLWWRWWMNWLGEMVWEWPDTQTQGRMAENKKSAGTTKLRHLKGNRARSRITILNLRGERFYLWGARIQMRCMNGVRKQAFQKTECKNPSFCLSSVKVQRFINCILTKIWKPTCIVFTKHCLGLVFGSLCIFRKQDPWRPLSSQKHMRGGYNCRQTQRKCSSSFPEKQSHKAVLDGVI